MKPWEKYQSNTESSGGKPWLTHGGNGQEIPPPPPPPPPPPKQQPVTSTTPLQDVWGQLKRQAGLTGRYAVEGGLSIPAMIADLPAALLNKIPGLHFPDQQQALSDYLTSIGLPKPQTPEEKIVGEAAKTVASGGGILKGAQLATKAATGPVTKAIAESMTVRPELQMTSAAGAGGAGEATKEAGGNSVSQLIASVLGGIGAPLAVSGGQKTIGNIQNVYKALTSSPDFKTNIDLMIQRSMADHGVNYGDVADNVKNMLRNDIETATKRGELNPDVVRRLVDYRLTGATPTAGPLTLDPGTITRQKNLAKIGINSNDPSLQKLARIENENALKLIDNLNMLGANRAGSNYEAGQKIIDTLDNMNSAAQDKINLVYKAAKDTAGRSAALDPKAFTESVDQQLTHELLNADLPSEVRNEILNKVAAGETPLTIDTANQMAKRLYKLQKPLSAYGPDAGKKMAINIVRNTLLHDTPLLPGQEMGQQAKQAFDLARGTAAKWLSKVDEVPALKAVRDGVEPDKFVQTYITGSGNAASINNVMKLRNLIQDSPEAMGTVRNNIAQFLKDKAIGTAPEEAGNFSQSAYNKALKSIGLDKIKMFFNPDEVNILKAVGRVASYEQVQPKGSAVNNSNTATTAISAILDRIAGSTLLRKIPYGAGLLSEPAARISGNVSAESMMKTPVMPKMASPKTGMIVPAAALAVQNDNNQ